MNFIEKNVIGQQSYVYFLKNHSQIKFKLLPMVHIGEEEFYKNIMNELEDCNLIISEGVQTKKWYVFLPSYKKIAKEIGLISQSDGIDYSYLKNKIIVGDMKPETFDKEIESLNFFNRILLYLISPLFYLFFKVFITRNYLLNQDSITERDYGIDIDDKIGFVIRHKRDLKIIQKIEKIYNERLSDNENITIGLLYGALHCPAIFNYLSNELKYNIQKAKRFTIIDL